MAVNIPDEIEKRYPIHGGFPTGVQAVARIAFATGAEWARKEALQEAAEVARTTALTLDDIGYEAEVIADAILELVEKPVTITITNPHHTPLGKYEVAD